MDPNNINKTGFCNSETDHIISNELKFDRRAMLGLPY